MVQIIPRLVPVVFYIYGRSNNINLNEENLPKFSMVLDKKPKFSMVLDKKPKFSMVLDEKHGWCGNNY